jgi:putative sulfotransferase
MDRAVIISNGRCGSTLLSDLIVEEPETLSVQEFFMSVAPWNRSTEVLGGPDYWRVLSGPKEELSVLFRIGVPPREVRYPATGRYAHDLVNLPRILAITLPKLTDDPDALFDLLAARVPRFPTQPVAAHHRDFLDLLAELLGRRRWVERSGGSSQVAQPLLANYPGARIVHLTRNWADTARSMSRHPSFQLVQLRVETYARYGVDPFTTGPGDGVPAEVEPYLPHRLTAETLAARGADPARYLSLCAFMTSQTEQALADSPPRHLLTMAYEELVADPVGQLTGLGRFLGFGDAPGWAASVAHRVKAPTTAAA